MGSWKVRENHFFGDLFQKRRVADGGNSAQEAKVAAESLARQTGKSVEVVPPSGDVLDWCDIDRNSGEITWRNHDTSGDDGSYCQT